MICYAICNLITGQRYIGITNGTVEKRWKNHVRDSFNGWSGSIALARAIVKYGPESFAIEELACCRSHEDLFSTERLLIVQEGTKVPHGYNIAPGGEGAMFGRRHTAETKAKISAAKKGRKLSEQHVAKMSEAMRGDRNPYFGKKHSLESLAKMSEVHRGNKHHLGYKHSPEAREKMSAALRGENHPQWGKPLSEETRAKISEGRRGSNNPMSAENRARRAALKESSP